jgi:glycosyltransferase involved in cell wall biosynthesis
MEDTIQEPASPVLYVSTFPPRECGIATFTKDLTTAMGSPRICAMNNGIAFKYGNEVDMHINELDVQRYVTIARRINKDDSIKVINIQHEFGIYGGKFLNYLSAFLETIQKPVVITLHSVVPSPPDNIKSILQYLTKKAARLVVMAEKAVDILHEDYGVDKSKVSVIPHGIHEVPYENGKVQKEQLGYNDRLLLSSFGLISGGKDYETIIKALPEVVKQFPHLLYLIIGQTHPGVLKDEGEKYRNYLKGLIEGLGLEKHVKFVNKYLALPDLLNYLKATDIFLLSGKGTSQITSGTLSYAMGCGKPVVSHPFIHAQEVVTPERGVLVELGNSRSYTEAISMLLANPSLRESMGKNAYAYTRNMTWPRVAEEYRKVFDAYVKVSNLTSESLCTSPTLSLK